MIAGFGCIFFILIMFIFGFFLDCFNGKEIG